MTSAPAPPAAILEHYALEPDSIERLPGGHINASFGARRTDGTDCVLQRLNPIFPAAVNDDIDAITRHLQAKGLVTPRLVPTGDGRPCLETGGAVWRVLTRIEGETRETLDSDDEAREAGRVLGTFHAALADYTPPLANTRPCVHDLERHLDNLQRTLEARAAHPAHGAVTALARRIFGMAGTIEPLPALPARLVHGDPKISNVIFRGGHGVCLIDLDTLTHMPAPLELGDALRSWCNTAAEDSPAAAFSLARARAALDGYRQGAGALLDATEWQAVPDATFTIAVELAARFAADALEESYFAWDRQHFASAGAHNRARASAQLALAASIEAALPALRRVAVTMA